MTSVTIDKKTLEPAIFEELKEGDQVWVVVPHDDGTVFMVAATLTNTDDEGSWKAGYHVIAPHPSLLTARAREAREIYRKKFVFPQAWGSVVEAWDDVIKETRRFVLVAEDEWAREVDGNAYAAEEILRYYTNPKVIRDGV